MRNANDVGNNGRDGGWFERHMLPVTLASAFAAAVVPAVIWPMPGSVPDGGEAAHDASGMTGHYEIVWVDGK